MNSKVRVLADATTKTVVNLSDNPKFGYIRVEQVRNVVDDKGFWRRKPVSAIVPGLLEELQAENFYEGQELSGRIVIKEALTPFNDKTPERDLKIAGETGIVCKFEGSPIYRKTVYTLASNAEDVLIKHDNVEELRAAYDASQKANSSAIKNAAGQEFNI
jgi:hypothetical protein